MLYLNVKSFDFENNVRKETIMADIGSSHREKSVERQKDEPPADMAVRGGTP